MAWIQAHQSLPTHRKTLRAADALDIPPVYVVGHMISLWLWAIDNVPDGSLAGITPGMIARAAQWTGEAALFSEALLSAGFFEETDDGLRIRNWEVYCGKLVKRRERDSERVKNWRETKNERDCNADVTHNNGVTFWEEKSRVDKRIKTKNKISPSSADADGQILTQPAPPAESPSEDGGARHSDDGIGDRESTGTVLPASAPSTADIPVPPAENPSEDGGARPCGGGIGNRKGADLDTFVEARFAEFWQGYPLKKDKNAARKAFRSVLIGAGRKKIPLVLSNMEHHLQEYCEQVSGQDPKYIKHASTWLRAVDFLEPPPDNPVSVRESREFVPIEDWGEA